MTATGRGPGVKCRCRFKVQEKVSITHVPGEGQGAALLGNRDGGPAGHPSWLCSVCPCSSPDCPLSGLDGRRRREETRKQDHLVRSALGKGREWGSRAKDLLSRRFHLECQAPSPQGRHQPEISPAPQALEAAAAVHRHLTAWRLPRPALLSRAHRQALESVPGPDWPGGF